ncbi:competence protein CoiA [Bhargavaea ullalensis]
MLSAMMDNGIQLILTRQMTKSTLSRLREEHQFHCPQCEGRMWLRLGDVRIPHFAHRAGSECRTEFAEGESETHLAGKQLLYEMFSNLGLPTGMETRIKSINQRPDLLVEKDGRPHAIEFQCSPIPRSLVSKRTEGFLSLDIGAHWIPATPGSWGGPGPSVRMRSIPDFIQIFYRHDGTAGKYVMTFDPLTAHFYYFNHPMHVSGQSYIGKTVALPYTDQHFPFAVPARPDPDTFRRYLKEYAKRRKAFLDRRILLNRKGINDPLLRACYENGVMIGRLSPYIGVPTLHAERYAVHAAEWQAQFVFLLASHGALGRWKNPGMIGKFLRKHPADRGEGRQAVEAYARFLERSGITTMDDLMRREVLSDESVRLLWNDFLANQSEN